ncbi:alpha-ketoglutarate-dependent sulfonate dioxygenase [Schizosaccharomyces octosporus yFS286]|uniref:Alpha-ketoglutarate-dependent sulfonate dioxygenase n=1 Tax=Schizosaccharomyces octosporus (strain yFS286) TaxID=483514 RepID=S9PR95_SCHOY|nr:alpha-ketoglutarate-dependent sulfonate dioxygenase [Schizosaccharomyces octosporus yFS286]EPX71691.1 alpha-ketoglutarate-dependent sulfonate dioxygenase [Schizosaccharomyces octosporus yFS286]
MTYTLSTATASIQLTDDEQHLHLKNESPIGTSSHFSRAIFNGHNEKVEQNRGDTFIELDLDGRGPRRFALPKDYKFADVLPSYPKQHDQALGDIKFHDRGISADPSFSNLLRDVTKVEHLSRDLGTVLHGLRLNQLNDAQKNELARLIAERGVVYFPHQEELTNDEFQQLGRYYGVTHVHGANARPNDPAKSDFHVVYSDRYTAFDIEDNRTNLERFHSDVSYEKQPLATTFFRGLTVPEYGGDTVFVSGYAAYEALSDPLKHYLEGLTAVHSGVQQAKAKKELGLNLRREGIETAHPIVRTHPVTGWKALYVNPGFTRYIVGIPRAESDAILGYLFELLSTLSASTIRVRWSPYGVAAWDNRIILAHSATYDHYPQTRHFLRIGVHGEKPFYDPNSKERAKDLQD